MPQGSFEAQLAAFAAQTKDRIREVRNEAAERVIDVMQEPGWSKATARMAVAGGVGLGKLKASGRRGVSRKAFGPIPNPGGRGNMPIDTGFLRASLVVVRGGALPPTRPKPEDGQRFDYDPGPINLAIAGSELKDVVTVVYTAAYARVANYGGKNRQARLFVDLAAQQWQSIVAEVTAEVVAGSAR